VEETFRVEG